VIFDNMPSSAGFIKAGAIRALGVTSTKRDPEFPNVPPISDTVPGYEATAWFGIGMPKGTPMEVVNKVNAEVNRMLKDPGMIAKFAKLGGTPSPGTPEDFQKTIQAETDKWAPVVAASGAKVE
jgi:tripartite-type tricarboxylate transporter receptor subunit TctC